MIPETVFATIGRHGYTILGRIDMLKFNYS